MICKNCKHLNEFLRLNDTGFCNIKQEFIEYEHKCNGGEEQ